MGFWLELGLSGFRVDAVPFFLETMGVPGGDAGSARSARVPPRPAGLLGPAHRRRHPARRGEPAHEQQLAFFGGDDGDELHMLFDFIGMQRLYLSLARADAAPLAEALLDPAAAAAGVPVGELRPQPRRAHPGQAHRGRAPGGLRRLRPGAGDAGLRTRADPAAAAHARRRSAADQDGLQPAVLPARDAGAVLRRGDRDGREPRGRRPAGGAYADAVDRRAQRRVLERGAVPAVRRSCRRARSRPSTSTSPTSSATRTRCCNFSPHARDQRYRDCPELGWGTFDGPGAAARGGAGPPLHLGRRLAASRCTTRPPSRSPCRSRWTGWSRALCWSTCYRRARPSPTSKGRVELSAGRLRLPLAPGHPPGLPPPPVGAVSRAPIPDSRLHHQVRAI